MSGANAILLLIRRSEAVSSKSLRLHLEQLRLIEENRALRLANRNLMAAIVEARSVPRPRLRLHHACGVESSARLSGLMVAKADLIVSAR